MTDIRRLWIWKICEYIPPVNTADNANDRRLYLIIKELKNEIIKGNINNSQDIQYFCQPAGLENMKILDCNTEIAFGGEPSGLIDSVM